MPRIDDFTKLYSKENTRRGYKTSLRHYFDVVYRLERVNNDAHYEALADRYIAELDQGIRKLENDVLAFTAALNNNAPITARSRIAAVKEFMLRNGHDFSPVLIRDIRREIPKGYSQSEEDEMDRNTLKKILQHCDVRGRAIFLVLVSSGMRVGEVLHITLDDIDLTKKPARISIRREYTKTRTARFAYISEEATDAVNAWLKIRTAHMASAENRNAGLVAHGLSTPKKKDDPRLFPYEYKTVDHAWSTAVKKAELFSIDDITKRKTLHVHMLRKFFRTNAATKVPVDLAEHLMGHAGYLSASYRRYTKEQLAEYYKKAEPALTVFQNDDRETKEKVSALTQENEELKRRLNDVELKLKADVQGVTNKTVQNFTEVVQDPKQLAELLEVLNQLMAKQTA